VADLRVADLAGASARHAAAGHKARHPAQRHGGPAPHHGGHHRKPHRHGTTPPGTLPVLPPTPAPGTGLPTAGLGASPPASGSSTPGPVALEGGTAGASRSFAPLLSPAGPGNPLRPVIVTGPDAGAPPLVKVFDATTGQELLQFLAYPASFTGGVRVAAADLTGDGIPDIITAPGPGMPPEIKVFNGATGAQLPGPVGDFLAYNASFTGGVFVSAGDVNGDGVSDIITGPGAGGGSEVKAFSGTDASPLAAFAAYGPGYQVGVPVAAGYWPGVSHAYVIAGSGPGAGTARVLDPQTGTALAGPLGNLDPYGPAYHGGVWVAAGDVNGDGTADIVTGAGLAHTPEVKAFSGSDGSVLDDFRAGGPSNLGGVRVAAAPIAGPTNADLVTAGGPGSAPQVSVYGGSSQQMLPPPEDGFLAYAATQRNGLFVAAADDPTVTVTLTPATQTLVLGATATVTVTWTSDVEPPIGGASSALSWGDGRPVPLGADSPSGSVTASHTYTAAGTYTLSATVGLLGSNGSAADSVHGTITITAPPPQVVPQDDCPCSGGSLLCTPAGENGPTAPEFSDASVRYGDGVLKLAATDLTSDGFGTPWGQERSWSNGPGYAAGSDNGNGWVDTQQPHLLQANGTSSNSLALVSNATTARYYDLSGGTYQPQFADQSKLVYNASTDQYTVTDSCDDQLTFAGFGSSWPAARKGALESYADPEGNLTQVTSWMANGQPQEVQRTTTSDGTTVTESYLFSYLVSGPNAGLLQSETLRRQTDGGLWATVRQAQYTYYDGTAPYGNQGDLETAEVLDGSGDVLDTSYYRYYTSADAGDGGYVGGLKYAFGPDSDARLVAALGSTAPADASDDQVAAYADDAFQYDSQHRVTQAVVQGQGCSSCSGGQGTYNYSYTTSSNPAGPNSWATKTVETLPDGNQNTVYTNSYGEAMLSAYTDTTTDQTWDTFTAYNSAGQVTLQASPSAVTGYDDSYADLLNNQGGTYQYLSNTSGLIQLADYYSTTTAGETTAGGVAGYQQDTKLEQGQQGTPVPQETWQYYAHTAGGNTVNPVATDTVYRNTDGTGAETTSYAYTWFGGTTQMQSVAVSKPVISAAENGPGTADVTTTFFDGYGRPIWNQDPDGFLTYTAYDPATGVPVTQITDVNTADTGEFTNLPAGWSTPSGGGLNLATTQQVDGLGRTIEQTDPDGNVTYTVYDDPNYEVRVYPGWDSNTGTPTGPTQVTRYDRPGSYTETLTLSAAPHLTNGVPDGTEAIADVQALSRQYTNAAEQVVREDDYFDLSGVTYSTDAYIGTQGTNYYTTLYGYDDRGREDHVEQPTGTIEDTVYDGLGRVVSTWVGTNDTPGDGQEWSPSDNTAPANMIQVAGYVYDNSGVGDGDLTQQTQYPGGSAANRVTQNWYDWRDRLVGSKQGVETTEDTTTHRPITYTTLDNLGEAVTQQQYDGDTVTLTTSNGVPQPPSASLLRAQTNYSYDDQGRVYQAQLYSVDPGTGAVSSTALTTNAWFNHRGLQIKESDPGGLVTKKSYDGAGRLIVTYTTDGSGDAAPGQPNNWANAGTVSTTNNVLTQVETSYDGDGNTILTTTRQRNHDETTGGPLGNPTTAPKARVSFVATYYDTANRLTTMVDVGTNGGTAWTRPSTPPAASDTVLVNSTGYAADSVQQVQLTGSPSGGTFTLSFNGQTTAGIAYNATAAVVQTALQNLSTVGSGNALVAGGAGGPWEVRFAGTLGGSVQPALTGSGSGLTGGTSPSVALRVTSLGGDAGRVQQTTDPRGIVTKTDYDWLGRTVRTVQAFSAFNPSNNADKTTEYTYDGGNHVLTLQADLVGGAYEQTRSVYGVTTAGGSGINSNDILAATQYPDPTTGNASSSQQETYTVNALGDRLTFSDRNGSVHSYSYDVLGRLTSDQVTTLGSGVDGTVQRIDTAYDTQGNAYLLTSYSTPAGTTIVNQVERAFNGLGQLTQEWQSHSGAVNTSTTPSVQYTYSLMAGGANHSRLTSIIYPNGKVLSYSYNSGLDDSISRLSSLSDSSGILESYSYLGLDTVVKRAHPQPNVDLTYITPGGSGDAGDQYTGLDRFGRVVDQRWYNNSTSTATDEFKYGYDRDGNVLYRTNEVNHNFDELYHANGSSNGYDNLNQLTAFARGVLNSAHDTIGSPSHTITWSLDAVGNFASTVTDGGSAANNTVNKQNEEMQAGSATLAFDANGNTTTDDSGHVLVYDAWNRLVAYKSGSTILESYKYDALNRRIVETPGSNTNDLYYSAAWQVLEERLNGVTTATVQYVWSPVYIDALVLRDRSTLNNSTLDERLWVQQDMEYNVTALLNTSGGVVERYIYDPYGKVTFLSPTWGNLSSSAYAWVYLHQGGRLDTTSQLYYFRNRDYSSTLGRWLQLDPIGFSAGDVNLYGFVSNNPIDATDPKGTHFIYVTSDWSTANACGCPCCCPSLAGGHGALIVGNRKDGYYYYSFEGDTTLFGYGTGKMVANGPFATLDAAVQYAKGIGYKRYCRFLENQACDTGCRNFMLSCDGTPYLVTGWNCGDVAAEGMRCGGNVPHGDCYATPKGYYNEIQGSAHDSGNIDSLIELNHSVDDAIIGSAIKKRHFLPIPDFPMPKK
jgi:RHS repeat-associated protein